MSRQDVSAGPQGSDTAAAEPPSFDITRAHPARVYDYWLGGKDNYEADREVAQAIAPESRIVYVDNDPIVLAQVLQYVPDEDHPQETVSRLMDAVPSGST